jgi:hypothetical protein
VGAVAEGVFVDERDVHSRVGADNIPA